MSLVAIIALLVLGWVTVAAAMLWGVLRISRRHHPALPAQLKTGEQPQARTATSH